MAYFSKMTKVYFIAIILVATSCFKDKNCKRLTEGYYTATFYQSNGVSYSNKITINYNDKGILIINDSQINTKNCIIDDYYSVAYQSSTKIKGTIKKIKHKKYKIEGSYHREYIYNKESYVDDGTFLISNN